MKTIKLKSKFRGVDDLELYNEPWDILSNIDSGTLTESENEIEIKTINGELIKVNKTVVRIDNILKTTYPAVVYYLNDRFYFFFDKLKIDGAYIMRGFSQNHFCIEFTTNDYIYQQSNLPFDIDELSFLSTDHIRYSDGQVSTSSFTDSEGHNKGANREIQIKENIKGLQGYIVTILNLDGNHPVWGNRVQMAPKQMKIFSVDSQKIILQGFGLDPMGASFDNYGMTIYHNGYDVHKIKLHMFDKNVDIEYLK